MDILRYTAGLMTFISSFYSLNSMHLEVYFSTVQLDLQVVVDKALRAALIWKSTCVHIIQKIYGCHFVLRNTPANSFVLSNISLHFIIHLNACDSTGTPFCLVPSI